MEKYIVVAAFFLYVSANAVYAVSNPQGWARSKWTARRNIDPLTNPWNDADVRAWGVVLVFIALGLGWIAMQI